MIVASLSRNAASWTGGAALLLGLPLLGVWLSGAPMAPYLEMPPRTDFVTHAAFSWPIFCGLASFIIAVIGPFVFRVINTDVARKKNPPLTPPRRGTCSGTSAYLDPLPGGARGGFPWWGWCALVFGGVAWILAWTRFPWFAPFQPFTFTPLWLAYIVVMNALAYRRTGRSPLTHRTLPYLALFPMSAVFWWFFEYLNRFVQNWHYIGIAPLTAEEYVLRATLPFATVLPAFVATRAWLASSPHMWVGLASWNPLTPKHPRRLAWMALVVSALGLAGIGIWHEFLFPLLWISPLIVIASIRALNGTPTLLNDTARGDWRNLVMAALSALVCGFFWEMWNLFSLEKWIYTVPFVDRFHLFEMPLLGYAGYLPFGIECALMAEWAESREKPMFGVLCSGLDEGNTEPVKGGSKCQLQQP